MTTLNKRQSTAVENFLNSKLSNLQELACSEHKEQLERLICEQQHWKNAADRGW